jgi:hypothetical protein
MTTKGSKKPGTFQPGKSGNPKGRPKVRLDLRAAVLDNSGKLFEALMKQAVRGKGTAAVSAALGLIGYAYRKPSQAVELSTPQGRPLEVQRGGVVNVSAMSTEELHAFRDLCRKAIQPNPAARPAAAGDHPVGDPAGGGSGTGGEGAP